jgi:phosphohistidine phosphatase
MSLRFYLVRHGRAEAKGRGDDASRRLSAEGRQRFRAHAKRIAPRLSVARIATSPLARARETADLLAAAVRAPVEEEAALASGASEGRELLDLGRRLGAGAALVGHNPELAEAASLAAGRHVEVPPGAVLAVECDGGRYSLAWLEAP